MNPSQYTPCEKMAVVLEMITEAAVQGRVCPTNEALYIASGYASKAGVSKSLRLLVNWGCLEYARKGQYRIFHVPSLGLSTRDQMDELAAIVKRAAIVFDTTERDIVSDSRFAEHVTARRAVMLTAKRLSYPDALVGRALGRDHSTVGDGLRCGAEKLRRSMDFRNRVARLQSYFLECDGLAA